MAKYHAKFDNLIQASKFTRISRLPVLKVFEKESFSNKRVDGEAQTHLKFTPELVEIVIFKLKYNTE